MKNILVTGGLGFIGNNLVADLLNNRNYKVRILDIARPESATLAFDVRKTEIIHGDITDTETIESAVKGMDAVIHLAAHTRVIDSIADPTENFRVNAQGTFGILMAMRKTGVPYLINGSTGGAILGDASPPVHEDMPARPLSPYGAGKLAAEGYCSAFAGAYGMKTVSLRFSNIYGPWSQKKESVVANFIKKIKRGDELVIYGDGNQTRDFLYVGDLSQGIIQALETQASGVYQLGTNIPTTINELIAILKDVMGSSFRSVIRFEGHRDGEIVHNTCDISRARNAFKYDPRTTVTEGVARTWDWYSGQVGIAA